MQTEIIERTIATWTTDPEKALVTPMVKASSDGPRALIETGPFSWHSDLPPALGGENKAASPTAMLLGALSGCAVLLIRDTLAPQLGLRVDTVRAEVRCRTDFRGLLDMPGAVPDLQDLELAIHIDSPEPQDRIETLYRAWLERCPIYLALTRPMALHTALTRTAPAGAAH
jgi:uncharacterized OsmC-like protein